MNDPLATLRNPLIYKLVVAGMTLSAMNNIVERLGIASKPIEPKDIIGCYVSPPGLDKKPMLPEANFQTTNLMFIFRDGKLYGVMNTKTNIESVEHYRTWAKMPSLIDSNGAYHLATNLLSRIFVDVPTLNKKYKLSVGQPFFWGDQGTNKAYVGIWHVGTNKVMLPLYYVTWNDGDYQAAKVGIFGSTKQFMGLTVEDASLMDHTFLYVTNQRELVNTTNVPLRMGVSNNALLHLFYQLKPPPAVGSPFQ